MGLAKYYEDNLEIFETRQGLREKSKVHHPEKGMTSSVAVHVSPVTDDAETPAHVKKLENKIIICGDCGRKFIFSVKAQLFHEKMGWGPPKRCKSCRELRNAYYLMR